MNMMIRMEMMGRLVMFLKRKKSMIFDFIRKWMK